jgi:hypothetical protein
MDVFCKELNISFDSKQNMFKALKENKEQIISLKKSNLKRTQGVSLSFKSDSSTKGENVKKLEYGDRIKVAMNTTNYLDYDMDLLIKNSWNRTAKEQNGKTYHVINHELAVGSVIAYPKDVTITVEEIEWSKLGKSYSGKTQVLVFDSKLTEKTNKDAFLAYRDGEAIEHSIRLAYIKIDLALDSNAREDVYEKELYDKHYSDIANKEDFEEINYFWVVTEAMIHKEGSMVLFGANDATPILDKSEDTLLDNHLDSSQSNQNKEFYLSLLNQ